MINLVYFGSPEFSKRVLEKLNSSKEFRVVAIVTNPDKPLGRKKLITPTPVGQFAQDNHLPVFKPEKLNEDNLAHLKLFKPDIFLVFAYGKIIPQSYLDTPTLGTLNIHLSLLPKYRGALCVSEAIKNGDKTTGYTLMVMDKDLDHGPIITQKELPISDTTNTTTLTEDLTDLTLKTIEDDLLAFVNWKKDGQLSKDQTIHLPPIEQNHDKAVLTPRTSQNTKQNAYISWEEVKEAMDSKDAHKVSCFIRSHNDDPGANTKIKTQKGEIELKLLKVHTQDDHLILDQVQIPGKNPVTWAQFQAGYQIR